MAASNTTWGRALDEAKEALLGNKVSTSLSRLQSAATELATELEDKHRLDGDAQEIKVVHYTSLETAHALLTEPATQYLRLYDSVHLTDPQEGWYGIDADSKLAADSFKRKRRPNLNFHEMGIPVGARLSFRNDEAVVVQVVDDRKVRMDDGEARSLTSVTQAVLETEYSIAPAPQWRYNGRLLSEIYDETYGT